MCSTQIKKKSSDDVDPNIDSKERIQKLNEEIDVKFYYIFNN